MAICGYFSHSVGQVACLLAKGLAWWQEGLPVTQWFGVWAGGVACKTKGLVLSKGIALRDQRFGLFESKMQALAKGLPANQRFGVLAMAFACEPKVWCCGNGIA